MPAPDEAYRVSAFTGAKATVPRLDRAARGAVEGAQRQARRRGDPQVLPVHLVMGLLGVNGGGTEAMQELGVSAAGVAASLPDSGAGPVSGPVPTADRLNRVLAIAGGLADPGAAVGTAHLVLALADECDEHGGVDDGGSTELVGLLAAEGHDLDELRRAARRRLEAGAGR